MRRPNPYLPVYPTFRSVWVGITWIGLVLLGSLSNASDFRQAQDLLETYFARADRAAVSAAVVRGNALLWSGTVGTANKALEVAATDDTAFLIASISKTVTATAVMQLVEDGLLELDTDINSYLPFTFRNPKQPGAVVTLRHLLAHTSGLKDIYYNSTFLDLTTEEGDPELSLADFCRAFFTLDGAFYYPATFTTQPPGTAFDYSNLGYALLGCIVEHASGRAFDKFTAERIFTPLGMTRTSWRVADFQTEGMAMPYGHFNEVYGNYTRPDYPVGGLRTTARDLSKFLRAFMLGGTLDGHTILEPASVREMKRVQYPNAEDAAPQGLGWAGLEFTDQPETTFLGHTGGSPGVFTLMAFDPATETGAIILTNGDIYSQDDADAFVVFFLALIELGNR